MKELITQLTYAFNFSLFDISIKLERLSWYLIIYKEAIHPVFFVCLLAIVISLFINEIINIIYKIFNLIILSILAVLLWLIFSEVLFIFIVYILAFIGAIIMLFLSVILMLPTSTIHRYTFNFSLATLIIDSTSSDMEEMAALEKERLRRKKLKAQVAKLKKQWAERPVTDQELEAWVAKKNNNPKKWASFTKEEKLFWIKKRLNTFRLSEAEKAKISDSPRYWKTYLQKKSVEDRKQELYSAFESSFSDFIKMWIKHKITDSKTLMLWLKKTGHAQYGENWTNLCWALFDGYNSWNEFFWLGIVFKSGSTSISEWFNNFVIGCIRDYIFWPFIFPTAFIVGFVWLLERFNFNIFFIDWFYYTPDTFNQFINNPVHKNIWLMPLPIDGFWTSTFTLVLKHYVDKQYDILSSALDEFSALFFVFLNFFSFFSPTNLVLGYFITSISIYLYFNVLHPVFSSDYNDILTKPSIYKNLPKLSKLQVNGTTTVWGNHPDNMIYLSYSEFNYLQNTYPINYSFILTDLKNNFIVIFITIFIIIKLSSYFRSLELLNEIGVLTNIERRINLDKLISRFKKLETDIDRYMVSSRDRSSVYATSVELGFLYLSHVSLINKRNKKVNESLQSINNFVELKELELDKLLDNEELDEDSVIFYEKREKYFKIGRKYLYTKRLRRRLNKKLDFEYARLLNSLYINRKHLIDNVYFKLIHYYNVKSNISIYGDLSNKLSIEVNSLARVTNKYYNLRPENKLTKIPENYETNQELTLLTFNEDPLLTYNKIYEKQPKTLEEIIRKIRDSNNEKKQYSFFDSQTFINFKAIWEIRWPNFFIFYRKLTSFFKEISLLIDTVTKKDLTTQEVLTKIKTILMKYSNFNLFLIYNSNLEEDFFDNEVFVTLIKTPSFNYHILFWVVSFSLAYFIFLFFYYYVLNYFNSLLVYNDLFSISVYQFIKNLYVDTIILLKKLIKSFYNFINAIFQFFSTILFFIFFVPLNFKTFHQEWLRDELNLASDVASFNSVNELEQLKNFLYSDFYSFLIIGVLILLVALLSVAISMRVIVKEITKN